MAGSQAQLVRETLASMGLIDVKCKPEVNDVLRRQRQEAAKKSHAARKAKREAEQIAKGLHPGEGLQVAKKPAAARDSGENSQPQSATVGPNSGPDFAIPATITPNATELQNLQTVQAANVANARKILNDASVRAAQYLSDLVGGAIPDAPERLRLESAKVILQSQGVTGEQSAQQREKDISAMSKADLMAFIKAGTVELQRLKAAREAEIIDVSPSSSDAISDCDPLE